MRVHLTSKRFQNQQFVIFLLLSLYFFIQSKKKNQQVKASKDRKGNSFLSGFLLSMLNMFAIPFFCGTIATLEMFHLMSFDTYPVAFFILGSTIGTFCILFLYGKYAQTIQKRTSKITKDISLILSLITGLVAIFMLIKITFLNA